MKKEREKRNIREGDIRGIYVTLRRSSIGSQREENPTKNQKLDAFSVVLYIHIYIHTYTHTYICLSNQNAKTQMKSQAKKPFFCNIFIGEYTPQKLRNSHCCVPFTATFSKRRKIGSL